MALSILSFGFSERHETEYAVSAVNDDRRIESNSIIIAACVPSLRPFMISVSQSMSGKSHRSWLGGSLFSKKTNKYGSKSQGSNYALAPKIRSSDCRNDPKGHSGAESMDSRNEANAPLQWIKQTTDISTQWEAVWFWKLAYDRVVVMDISMP